jgi:hypothetical protein
MDALSGPSTERHFEFRLQPLGQKAERVLTPRFEVRSRKLSSSRHFVSLSPSNSDLMSFEFVP